MIEVHYGVVLIEGRWSIISEGLRLGAFNSRIEAERVVRRMADQAAGLPVHLHLQDEQGEIHRELVEAGERVLGALAALPWITGRPAAFDRRLCA